MLKGIYAFWGGACYCTEHFKSLRASTFQELTILSRFSKSLSRSLHSPAATWQLLDRVTADNEYYHAKFAYVLNQPDFLL